MGDERPYPNITVRLLRLYWLSTYLTARVRTLYVYIMYLAGRNWGNLNHIYVNIINAHTGKHSGSENSPWRIFPKRQTISEENYTTCAVDTAVVTVFVEVEEEWQDVSGLLAIWGEFYKREQNSIKTWLAWEIPNSLRIF